MLAFVLTVLFVPAVLAIVNPKIASRETEETAGISARSRHYSRWIRTHDGRIIVGSALFFILIGWGLFYVKVDSNTVRYFSENVEFRKTVQFMQENISGPMSYEVVVITSYSIHYTKLYERDLNASVNCSTRCMNFGSLMPFFTPESTTTSYNFV